MDKITISIASIPDRNFFLNKTIHSVHNQCDEIRVYLNNYPDVPEWMDRFPKVIPYLADNTYGDGARYINQPDKGWWLTCDDDIYYPSTYVSDMIAGAEKYGRRAIVTLHGSILGKNQSPILTGPDSREQVFRCLGNVDEDVMVNTGGTGVMCFHCDTFRPDLSRFERKNMADIWVAIQAKEAGIPIIVLEHEVGYLQYILPLDKWTIWKHTERNISENLYMGDMINKHLR